MADYPPIHRAAIAGDVAALRRELEAGVPPDHHPGGIRGYSYIPPKVLILLDGNAGIARIKYFLT